LFVLAWPDRTFFPDCSIKLGELMFNQWLYDNHPRIRQVLTHASYEWATILDKDNHFLLLNYGYVDLDHGSEPLPLSEADENQRYEIQLYHHLATMIQFNWEGLKVLEVSSGRGGGACYLKRQFKPESVTGVDFSRRAISFCNQYYANDGLFFMHGDAEALDFPDESFDIVVNIEASFYYPRIERFFNHVVRVLRPNGYFLYADMRYRDELKSWKMQLDNMNLQILKEENITDNVIRALELDKDRRARIIKDYAPGFLHKPFFQLSGVTGGGLINRSVNGNDRIYMGYVFHKNGRS
jgi:SAM-dependent methyltransferase